MQVTVVSQSDIAEPNADGSVDYAYVYKDFHFEDDGLRLFARAYDDDPDEVALRGLFVDERLAPVSSLYDAPLTRSAVEHLTGLGFRRFQVLDKAGYAPLDLKRLEGRR